MALAVVLIGVPIPALSTAAPFDADPEVGADDDRPRRVAKKRIRRKRKRAAPAPGNDRGVETTDLPPAPPLQRRRGLKTVALLPPQAIEIPEELGRAIVDALLDEIDEAGFIAVTPNDVRADLQALSRHGFTQPFATESCGGEAGCLATAGRYARAHFAIETRISGVGGTVRIALRLFDTQSQQEKARTADVLAQNDDRIRAEQLHRIAVELLHPERFVGSLVIACDEPGAEIYLNDKLLGTAPLSERVTDLPAGPYILRVTKEGFSDVYQFVDVLYRKTSTYRVDLNANTIRSVLVEQESDRGLGELYVYAPEGEFDLRIDGDPKGQVPLQQGPILEIAAGTRRLSLRYAGGSPLVQQIPIESGRRTEVAIERDDDGYRIGRVEIIEVTAALPEQRDNELEAGVPPPLSMASVEQSWRTPVGWIVGGAGVLALGGGLYFSALTDRFDDELSVIAEQDYPAGSPEIARAEELNGRGDDAERNQWIAYGAGGALIAIGAGLVVWDLMRMDSEPEPSSEVDVRAGVSPDSAYVGLTFQF